MNLSCSVDELLRTRMFSEQAGFVEKGSCRKISLAFGGGIWYLMRLFDGTPSNGLIFDIALCRTSQHRKRGNVKGGRPTVVNRSVGRGLVRAATLKKLPRVRVNANGRTLRIQRKVASTERPLILMGRNTMVRRVAITRRAFLFVFHQGS